MSSTHHIKQRRKSKIGIVSYPLKFAHSMEIQNMIEIMTNSIINLYFEMLRAYKKYHNFDPEANHQTIKSAKSSLLSQSLSVKKRDRLLASILDSYISLARHSLYAKRDSKKATSLISNCYKIKASQSSFQAGNSSPTSPSAGSPAPTSKFKKQMIQLKEIECSLFIIQLMRELGLNPFNSDHKFDTKKYGRYKKPEPIIQKSIKFYTDYLNQAIQETIDLRSDTSSRKEYEISQFSMVTGITSCFVICYFYESQQAEYLKLFDLFCKFLDKRGDLPLLEFVKPDSRLYGCDTKDRQALTNNKILSMVLLFKKEQLEPLERHFFLVALVLLWINYSLLTFRLEDVSKHQERYEEMRMLLERMECPQMALGSLNYMVLIFSMDKQAIEAEVQQYAELIQTEENGGLNKDADLPESFTTGTNLFIGSRSVKGFEKGFSEYQRRKNPRGAYNSSKKSKGGRSSTLGGRTQTEGTTTAGMGDYNIREDIYEVILQSKIERQNLKKSKKKNRNINSKLKERLDLETQQTRISFDPKHLMSTYLDQEMGSLTNERLNTLGFQTSKTVTRLKTLGNNQPIKTQADEILMEDQNFEDMQRQRVFTEVERPSLREGNYSKNRVNTVQFRVGTEGSDGYQNRPFVIKNGTEPTRGEGYMGSDQSRSPNNRKNTVNTATIDFSKNLAKNSRCLIIDSYFDKNSTPHMVTTIPTLSSPLNNLVKNEFENLKTLPADNIHIRGEGTGEIFNEEGNHEKGILQTTQVKESTNKKKIVKFQRPKSARVRRPESIKVALQTHNDLRKYERATIFKDAIEQNDRQVNKLKRDHSSIKSKRFNWLKMKYGIERGREMGLPIDRPHVQLDDVNNTIKEGIHAALLRPEVREQVKTDLMSRSRKVRLSSQNSTSRLRESKNMRKGSAVRVKTTTGGGPSESLGRNRRSQTNRSFKVGSKTSVRSPQKRMKSNKQINSASKISYHRYEQQLQQYDKTGFQSTKRNQSFRPSNLKIKSSARFISKTQNSDNYKEPLSARNPTTSSRNMVSEADHPLMKNPYSSKLSRIFSKKLNREKLRSQFKSMRGSQAASKSPDQMMKQSQQRINSRIHPSALSVNRTLKQSNLLSRRALKQTSHLDSNFEEGVDTQQLEDVSPLSRAVVQKRTPEGSLIALELGGEDSPFLFPKQKQEDGYQVVIMGPSGQQEVQSYHHLGSQKEGRKKNTAYEEVRNSRGVDSGTMINLGGRHISNKRNSKSALFPTKEIQRVDEEDSYQSSSSRSEGVRTMNKKVSLIKKADSFKRGSQKAINAGYAIQKMRQLSRNNLQKSQQQLPQQQKQSKKNRIPSWKAKLKRATSRRRRQTSISKHRKQGGKDNQLQVSKIMEPRSSHSSSRSQDLRKIARKVLSINSSSGAASRHSKNGGNNFKKFSKKRLIGSDSKKSIRISSKREKSITSRSRTGSRRAGRRSTMDIPKYKEVSPSKRLAGGRKRGAKSPRRNSHQDMIQSLLSASNLSEDSSGLEDDDDEDEEDHLQENGDGLEQNLNFKHGKNANSRSKAWINSYKLQDSMLKALTRADRVKSFVFKIETLMRIIVLKDLVTVLRFGRATSNFRVHSLLNLSQQSQSQQQYNTTKSNRSQDFSNNSFQRLPQKLTVSKFKVPLKPTRRPFTPAPGRIQPSHPINHPIVSPNQSNTNEKRALIRSSSMQFAEYPDKIPADYKAMFQSLVRPIHIGLTNGSQAPIRVIIAMSLRDNILDSKSFFINYKFKIASSKIWINRMVKYSFRQEIDLEARKDPWKAISHTLTIKLPGFGGLSDISDSISNHEETLLGSAYEAFSEVEYLEDNFCMIEDLQNYEFSKKKIRGLKQITYQLRHFIKKYLVLMESENGIKFQPKNDESTAVIKLSLFLKEKYVMKPHKKMIEIVNFIPNNFELYKKLKLETVINNIDQHDSKRKNLSKYRITGFGDDSPRGGQNELEGGSERDQPDSESESEIQRSEKKLNMEDVAFMMTNSLVAQQGKVFDLGLGRRRSKRKKFHKLAIPSNFERRKSNFNSAIRAVMKFKKGIRKFKDWNLHELPSQNNAQVIRTVIAKLVEKVHSRYWLCSAIIVPKRYALDTLNALEAFSVKLVMRCQRPTDTVKVALSLQDFHAYVRFPRENVMEYIARKLQDGIIKSEFQRKFLKVLQIKFRKEILAYVTKKPKARMSNIGLKLRRGQTGRGSMIASMTPIFQNMRGDAFLPNQNNSNFSAIPITERGINSSITHSSWSGVGLSQSPSKRSILPSRIEWQMVDPSKVESGREKVKMLLCHSDLSGDKQVFLASTLNYAFSSKEDRVYYFRDFLLNDLISYKITIKWKDSSSEKMLTDLEFYRHADMALSKHTIEDTSISERLLVLLEGQLSPTAIAFNLRQMTMPSSKGYRSMGFSWKRSLNSIERGTSTRTPWDVYESLMFGRKNIYLDNLRSMELIFPCFVPRIGRVLVEASLFSIQAINSTPSINTLKTFICLRVHPGLKKGRFYKMVVTNLDIAEWVSEDISLLYTLKAKMLKILAKFVKNLTLKKNQFYRRLQIDLSKFNRPNLEEQRVTNIKRMLIVDPKSQKFLAKETVILKPVGNFVIKIDGQYAVAILYKSKLLQEQYIRVYLPRTKRVFQVCLHNREFFQTNEYLASIIRKKISSTRMDQFRKAMVSNKRRFEKLSFGNKGRNSTPNNEKSGFSENPWGLKSGVAASKPKLRSIPESFARENNTTPTKNSQKNNFQALDILKSNSNLLVPRRDRGGVTRSSARRGTSFTPSVDPNKFNNKVIKPLGGGAPSRNPLKKTNTIVYKRRQRRLNSDVFVNKEAILEKKKAEIKFGSKNYEEFYQKAMGYLDASVGTTKTHIVEDFYGKIEKDIAIYKERKEIQKYKLVKHFKQLFYWEVLLLDLKMEARNHGKKVLVFGEFSSIARELIYCKEVSINSNHLLLEIFMETEKSENSMLAPFGSFRARDLRGIFFYVKVSNISKKYDKNTKITFQQAFDLVADTYQNLEGYQDQQQQQQYQQEEKSPLINVVELYRIGRNIGSLLQTKLAKAMISTLAGRDILKESNLQDFIYPRVGTGRCLHSRICMNLHLSEHNKYNLLFKTPFTLRPLQIACVMYNIEDGNFMVLIYHSGSQKYARIDLEKDYVLRFLPFTQEALRQKDYANCGRRIFKCFKNTLLVEYKLIVENMYLDQSSVGQKGTRVAEIK